MKIFHMFIHYLFSATIKRSAYAGVYVFLLKKPSDFFINT